MSLCHATSNSVLRQDRHQRSLGAGSQNSLDLEVPDLSRQGLGLEFPDLDCVLFRNDDRKLVTEVEVSRGESAVVGPGMFDWLHAEPCETIEEARGIADGGDTMYDAVCESVYWSPLATADMDKSNRAMAHP
jgi:hypothetical protein